MARKNKLKVIEEEEPVIEAPVAEPLKVGNAPAPKTRLCQVCYSEFKGERCPNCGSG